MKLILIFLFLFSLTQASFAGDFYTSSIDDVIGPFPTQGSADEVKDFEVILAYQNKRTKAECDQAESEASASLKTFFAGPKGPLTRDEALSAAKKLNLLTAKVGAKILFFKSKYNRPRPYLTNHDIKPCINLENSKAYPSGHATLARAYARILSIMFPTKEISLITRANEIATNRVLGGVHHPSDIEAGKVLGDSIADEYINEGDHFFQLRLINN
jgi:acid phosphatase (class A)